MRKDQELLLQAARQGDSAIVQRILVQRRSGPLASLRRGPGANVQDSTGFTPLHHAALNGHTEIVSLLLSADASPSIKDAKGSAPLHLAAWNGHEDIVSILLAHKTHKDDLDVDLKTNSGDTALHYAAQFGHRGVVTQLLKKNADPLGRNNKQETPLDLAAQFGRVEVVEELIKYSPCIVDQYKASRNRGTLFNSTPLHRASNNGHGSVVLILLKAGVDPNCRTIQGTALHVAATFGKLDVAKVLLERGADPRVRDEGGRNVLEVIATLPDKLAVDLERLISKYSTVKGLVEYFPPIPTIESPEYEHAPGFGAFGMNGERRLSDAEMLPSTNTKSTSKYQPRRFVKKIATKCFGVFHSQSAPDIAQGISSDIDKKIGRKSPTLQIGNSKFFHFISRSKQETSAVVCNDEFLHTTLSEDTISLDRFPAPSFNRNQPVNISNRSYPGFKNSLPNIVESDNESDASNESSSSFENLTPGYKREFPLPNLVENEFEFSENNNDLPNEQDNCKQKTVQISEPDTKTQYVNVTIQKVTVQPIPAARTNVSIVKPDILMDNSGGKIYENVTLKEETKPEPAKRTVLTSITQDEHESKINPVPPPKSKVLAPSLSIESTDSFEESFEDIMMSKKSSSFMRRRKPTNWTFLEKTRPRNIERKKSMRSESTSTTTEVLTLEDVDCTSDVSTLVYKRLSSTLPRTSFYSEKTLSPQTEFRTLPRSISKEVAENYHIKGTDKCVYQGPSFKDIMKAFNSDTLKPNEPLNRFSLSAICFCRPEATVKHSKSEGDLLDCFEVDSVNLDSYLKSVRNSIVSFQCYCDCASSCTLNHKKTDSYAVYYTPAKRSYSFPNLCDIDLLDDVRNPDKDLKSMSTENDTSLTFGALSETSTLRSDVASLDADTLEPKRSDIDLQDVTFRKPKQPLKHSKSLKPTFDPSVTAALSKYYTINSTVSTSKPKENDTEPNFYELSYQSLGARSSLGSVASFVSESSIQSCQFDSEDLGEACPLLEDDPTDFVDSGTAFGHDGDDYSLSSAASSQQHEYNKISPTPPKKPPRRNLSVSPTHASGPVTYGHMSRATHARSQDDLDDMQANKPYLKLGSSVDHCYDSKSFQEYHQENKLSPRPVPKPRPSIQPRQQPVAITTMYENVVIKEQNPKRKLRRNYENFEPRHQERSSVESLLEDSGFCVDGDRVDVPSSPTHYEQPPTPEHPPPSARQAELCIHERIRPLSQEYKRRSGGYLRDSWTETERCISRSSWNEDRVIYRDSWSEVQGVQNDSWSDEPLGLARTGSSGSVASSATTDNAIDEYVAAAPFGGLGSIPLTDQVVANAEEFVVQLYKVSPEIKTGDAARSFLFGAVKNVENLPPTSGSLRLHIRRCHYQVCVWESAHIGKPSAPSPEDCGWRVNGTSIEPILMTLPPIPASCDALRSCGCKGLCQTNQCRCKKGADPCMKICNCRALCLKLLG